MEVMTFNIDKDRRNLVDNKQNFSIDFHDSKYNWLQARQYEESMRQVEVHVVHGDGSPVDLTGMIPFFYFFLPTRLSLLFSSPFFLPPSLFLLSPPLFLFLLLPFLLLPSLLFPLFPPLKSK